MRNCSVVMGLIIGAASLLAIIPHSPSKLTHIDFGRDDRWALHRLHIALKAIRLTLYIRNTVAGATGE